MIRHAERKIILPYKDFPLSQYVFNADHYNYKGPITLSITVRYNSYAIYIVAVYIGLKSLLECLNHLKIL